MKAECILNDEDIKNIYKNANENYYNFWADHSFNHCKRVYLLCLKVMNFFELSENDKNNLKISALLHDLGAVYGKNGHTKKSEEMAKAYLIKNNVNENDVNMITHIISRHSDANFSDNLFCKIIYFCDKLDYSKTRLLDSGKIIIGLRQLEFTNDIEITKNENKLNVNFIVNDKFNYEEWKKYYFIEKVLLAIKMLADVLNVKPYLTINNKEIICEYQN